MDVYEMARLKRERNVERKTRALARKGIVYRPPVGDDLVPLEAAEKSEQQTPVSASAGAVTGEPCEPVPVNASAPIAAWIPGREGEIRITATVGGSRYSFNYLVPGLAGNIRGGVAQLGPTLLTALQTQFGKRIENVNDVS